CSSTSTPAHRTREPSLSGRPRPPWSRVSTASSISCHRARMFRFRPGPTQVRIIGGSPAASTPPARRVNPRHLTPGTSPGVSSFKENTMRIYVLDGAGTHGRHDNSVIAGGVDRLEGSLIRKHDPDTTAEWVPWQAALMGVGGNRESWETNSREGVRLLVERMKSHDEDVILIAYSAGNKPAHDFLNDHPEFHDRVAAVGFVSDPWRPRDRWQHGLGDPGGWGVCGEDYTPIPARCFWTAVPGDVIPCAQPD